MSLLSEIVEQRMQEEIEKIQSEINQLKYAALRREGMDNPTDKCFCHITFENGQSYCLSESETLKIKEHLNL